ncbi:MAG TPA: hypothetical protein VFN68_06625 [Acidimicrobiales bacterium]|nr:hypothetical protein [Acidimicrobiales bacterium]
MLASIIVPTSSLPANHRLTLMVQALDASGADLLSASGGIALAKITPNGPKCGPVCYFRAVTVSPGGRLSTTSG